MFFVKCLFKVVPMLLFFFGKQNYFVELHNHGIKEQAALVPELLKLAKEFDVKVVASNDVHYVKGEDWAPHDALLCIQTGSKLDDPNRMRYEAREFYLKSRAEMEAELQPWQMNWRAGW